MFKDGEYGVLYMFPQLLFSSQAKSLKFCLVFSFPVSISTMLSSLISNVHRLPIERSFYVILYSGPIEHTRHMIYDRGVCLKYQYGQANQDNANYCMMMLVNAFATYTRWSPKQNRPSIRHARNFTAA